MAIMPIIPNRIVNIKNIGIRICINNVETNTITHEVVAAQILLVNNATPENTAPRTIPIMCGVTDTETKTPTASSRTTIITNIIQYTTKNV